MSVGNKNLLGALFLAGALFTIIGLSFPAYRQIGELRASIQERTDLLETRKATMTKLDNSGREYDQRQAEISTFVAVVPSKKDTAELVSAVERIAAGSGVQLGSVNITAEAAAAQGGLTSRMQVAIDAKGLYPAMLAFLDSIEKNIRLLDVDSIEARTEGNQGNVLTFNIKASGYILKK